ncbi:ATP-binding protein (plasmid) [Synechocystis sp. PCC 7339]|uniref:ATP-binding protein n=1 Tax=Synechocystis sp. PCC 7339 TaxID=2782213 RepID=UPI001CBD95B9|nr:ATP-binding protein [Synechocystis sp. PCC 7339]UAJ74634.1 ATP-binding protein [Synechocystis sp. PCC 7339]
MTSVFHVLIGCPASGKSTLAAYLHEAIPESQIISTDQIREELFGDASQQGNWASIQAKISVDIRQALSQRSASQCAVGKQIIYDATNAQKAWRSELLGNLQKFDNLKIIGWYLQTPLEVCYQRNRNRQRQVPEDVIEIYAMALEKYPPSKDEGFTELHYIPHDQLASIDFSQLIS